MTNNKKQIQEWFQSELYSIAYQQYVPYLVTFDFQSTFNSYDDFDEELIKLVWERFGAFYGNITFGLMYEFNEKYSNNIHSLSFLNFVETRNDKGELEIRPSIQSIFLVNMYSEEHFDYNIENRLFDILHHPSIIDNRDFSVEKLEPTIESLQNAIICSSKYALGEDDFEFDQYKLLWQTYPYERSKNSANDNSRLKNERAKIPEILNLNE